MNDPRTGDTGAHKGEDEPARAADAGERLEALLAEHRDPPDPEADDGAPPSFDPFAPVPAGRADNAARSGSPEAGEEQDEAGDTLPDAPLFALLRTIEREVGIDRVDRIWVFPPRQLQTGQTAVVVVAAFPDAGGDRRRVYAAHYTAHEEARAPRLALDEYGTAPADRVGRMVEEVVERIKDEPAAAPRSHAIEGHDDRWNAVLHELAEAHLADAQNHRRIRR